jgi:hypothetical protein
LWAHEALRLFSDRLVARQERQWTDALLDKVAAERFGGALLADGIEAGDAVEAAAKVCVVCSRRVFFLCVGLIDETHAN